MRHFATESGKSKGQFYTPAEVSRVIARVIGISPANSTASTSVYDPTCGSGSLLLKVAAEAGKPITLEGQEMDVTTAGLARMNLILHDFPTGRIQQGNTLAEPKFKDGDQLRTYDYVVANPPFSVKTWSNGLTLGEDGSGDPHKRFAWGLPPAKQGDYAFLLHIVRSLKGSGKAACILPHGVLFRGHAEGTIRQNLVRSGLLKGIIGLPANLFYGTGIPACILVLDKENASARRGIFVIDASRGFIKDGNKNRLRERDLHRIVDVFTHGETHPGYSRLVPHHEIEKNDFNLNLPRYLDTQEAEDIQDIAAHLRGGLPARDLDALADTWRVCPDLRAALFAPLRPGYYQLRVAPADLRAAIHGHPQFAAFLQQLRNHFAGWRDRAATTLRESVRLDCLPKQVIHDLSENLLAHFEQAPGSAKPQLGSSALLDPYAVFQHLMDYWAVTMQDDAYLIAADGWVAATSRILETDKKGRTKDRGWTCDLVPKPLVVARYFAAEQAALDALQARLEAATARLAELEEEHGGEDGFLGALDKIARPEINARLKELKAEAGNAELQLGTSEAGQEPGAPSEESVLREWLDTAETEAALKKSVREAEATLDEKAYQKYPTLTSTEVQTLVVDDKWLASLADAVQGELDRVAQTLTTRIRTLAERYATPLPELEAEVTALAAKVDAHLKKMEAAAS